MNTLYYGDNLTVLRQHIKDESIDLIYLDPPFNSNANYNVLFDERDGTRAAAQIQAFEDTWRWDQSAAEAFESTIIQGGKVADALRGFQMILGNSDFLAYLSMMAPRLVELHRVLKPTGSLYLHCDPTASHYLKVILDAIFGPDNFRNEISWRRSNPKSNASFNFPNCRDILLRYSKTGKVVFNKQFRLHDPEYVEKAYRFSDDRGQYRLLPLLNPNKNRPNLTYEFLGITRVWRWTKDRMQKAFEDGLVVQLKPGAVPQYKLYLEESKGRTITNDWWDIDQAAGRETLGYPTQKPLELLDRIIQVSSNPGDIVLDPFCGCGTAVASAQKLGRQWIGIDITHLAISLIKRRLNDAYGDSAQYKVIGEPTTIEDAQTLAADDPYQFQWWALDLVGARPAEGKKGADKGIDGRLFFIDDATSTPKQVIISVKAGHISTDHLRDLRGVIERDQAQIGVLICMQEPSRPMRTEVASSGFYTSQWGKHPRIQILTIADLLSGKTIDMPPQRQTNITFKKARRSSSSSGHQLELGEE
jgi:DNA modification methylase